MGEKTRAEGTIAKAVRERKSNWLKNAGKMRFFLAGCGKKRCFSGFPSRADTAASGVLFSGVLRRVSSTKQENYEWQAGAPGKH
jgi:hypothetical protein